MFDLVFVLLLTKKDPILKEADYKRYALMVLSYSYFKMILVLLTKVITLYVQVSIV